MTYVDWFNHRRLHGEITDDASYTTPAEFEAAYYRQNHAGPRGRHPITRAVIEPGAVQTGDVGRGPLALSPSLPDTRRRVLYAVPRAAGAEPCRR